MKILWQKRHAGVELLFLFKIILPYNICTLQIAAEEIELERKEKQEKKIENIKGEHAAEVIKKLKNIGENQ